MRLVVATASSLLTDYSLLLYTMVPRVAIIGRPNVGKSSLLNMLARRRVSIVEATPGVTRDRISIELELPPESKGKPPRVCEMIDTGGYGVYSGDATYHVLTNDIEKQISAAVSEADLVMFVVDAQTGVVPLDEQVAKLLRERLGEKAPVLLVANKVDNEALEIESLEAMRLGFGEPVVISATTKRNSWGLIESIAEAIDWTADLTPPRSSEMSLAIVGKRNAGKSTLVNALAGAERVIASELPGTTRDSVDVRFEIGDRVFTAIDTAGVRKRKSIEDDVELFSMYRTLRSIRRADVVLLLIDCTGPISQVDKKLGKAIVDEFKPVVIGLNKWDLVSDKVELEDYLDYVAENLRGLPFAPVLQISAKSGEQVTDAVELAIELFEQATARVGTGELNAVLKKILADRGPTSKLGRRAKIYFAVQPEANPPTLVLFVNDPDMFTEQYQRYMVNCFREMLPFKEVPIKLVIRGRKRRDMEKDEQPIAEA